ncbi:MAG: hypothetical protein ACRDHW_18380, partial [Ktedonobacteraceae bacterium]
PRLIQLRYLPYPKNQTELLLTFRPRVAWLMIQSGLANSHMSSQEAELVVWQEIEEELLAQGMAEEQKSS